MKKALAGAGIAFLLTAGCSAEQDSSSSETFASRERKVEESRLGYIAVAPVDSCERTVLDTTTAMNTSGYLSEVRLRQTLDDVCDPDDEHTVIAKNAAPKFNEYVRQRAALNQSRDSGQDIFKLAAVASFAVISFMAVGGIGIGGVMIYKERK